jgi:pimeloyl-ACP methyl ester carboxylesterase
LHGLLFTPQDQQTDLALLFVHGVAMNFYLPPLSVFGQELAARGFHSFVINTRGHDWISRAGNLTKFGGSAYELLEDCLPDLDAALEFLRKQGYHRFVLIGHSLGAIKSIIYQGTRRRRDIVGIVSCSAPRQFYSERVARQSGFRELMDKAEGLIAEGEGDELLFVGVGATPGIFTARTHVNKYGRDDNNDCRPYAGRLGCALLALVGVPNPNFSTSMPRRSPRLSALREVAGWSTAPIIFIIVTHGSLLRLSMNGWSSFATEAQHSAFSPDLVSEARPN